MVKDKLKKLLITGTDGFVGKNLVSFYKDKYDVFTYTKNNDINNVLYNINPDIIINAAASIYDYDTIFDSNIVLVYSILQYIKQSKAKLIQIGSSAEYGIKNEPSKETDYLSPITFYAGSKAAATLMCSSYAKEFNLPIMIARPYSLYGIHEKEYRLFSALYNAYKFNKPMILNQGYHDFIYIKDFINGIDKLINYNNSDGIGDIINFGTGKQTSNFELLDIFQNIFNFIPQCITINNKMIKSFESKTWLCNIEYAINKYEFKCNYDIKSGIIDLFKEKENATRT